MVYWPCRHCLKLNSGKFEIFSNLMTGKGSLLQFFEADNVYGHSNTNNY